VRKGGGGVNKKLYIDAHLQVNWDFGRISTPTVITFGVSFELLLFFNVNCRYLVILFNEIEV
jgi:hypothetical protein